MRGARRRLFTLLACAAAWAGALAMSGAARAQLPSPVAPAVPIETPPEMTADEATTVLDDEA